MPAVIWVATEKIAQQLVWLLLFLILAPILGPRPYGQFAIVMVFIGFCELIMVDAAVEALLSVEPLEAHHLRVANFSSLSVAGVLGACLFFLAPYIAGVFRDPELEPISKALSVLPAISVLTSAPLAILKSQLRFGPIAIRSILGLAIGGVAGVFLALHGAGVWSLVAQVVSQRMAEVIILWSSARTRFGLGWSSRHFADLSHFARHIFVSRGMAFASGQIPRLILGFFLGPVDLGLYVLAARLPDMLIKTTIVPTCAVARVTFRQYAPGQKTLEQAFGRLTGDTAVIAFPICCGGAAVMPLAFAVALDARWQPAVFAAQVMILSVIPMVVFCASSALLLAIRYPQDEAKLSFAQLFLNSFFIFLVAPFGLNSASFVTLICPLFLLPMLSWIIVKRSGITARSIFAAIGPALFAALVMADIVSLVAAPLALYLGQKAALPALAVFGGLIYACIVALTDRPRAARIITSLKKLLFSRMVRV